MSNFCEGLWVEGHTLTFHFNLLVTHKGMRYCVSVVDAKRITHVFYMRKAFSRWILDQSILYPKWITEIEEELGALIAHREYLN